jgi:hypothetical protein
MALNNNKPITQRAFVLQGGGALGAYEVGVLKAMYGRLQHDQRNYQTSRHYPIHPGYDKLTANLTFLHKLRA